MEPTVEAGVGNCSRMVPVACPSFNSKLRDEFLNGEIFYSMKELRVLAER